MIQISFSPDVPDGYRHIVWTVYQELPVSVLDVLDRDHIHIRVADRMTDIRPELKGKKPWGYNRSAEQSCGMYSHGHREILLARFARTGPDTWTRGRDPRHTLYHEIGHAVDRLCSNLFLSRGFRDAFYEDYMNLKRLGIISTEAGLSHFARLTGRGRSETAAECIALIIGDDGVSKRGGTVGQNPRMHNHAWRFPQSFKFLRKCLIRLGVV